MIEFLIKRPVAVYMMTLALCLLGVYSALNISTSLMPDIPVPKMTVQITYPNKSARELEINVVQVLRNQLLQIANLKDIQSQTKDGTSTINLFFKHGVDTNLAFIEANEKVDAALKYLPKDLERPRLIKASTNDIPILNLTVGLKAGFSDQSFLELSEFSRTVLKKRIEQIPDVSMADMSGSMDEEVVITLNQNTLRSYNLSPQIINEAIGNHNYELSNLKIQNGIYHYNLKLESSLESKNDIENIKIKIDNTIIPLKQIANVILKPNSENGRIIFNGQRVITFSIIKQPEAQMNNLRKEFNTLLSSLKIEYPNLKFNINQDQTQILDLSISNLKSSLWIGSILAIIIMFIFLNDLLSPLIIAISIPVSLIISILFLYIAGISINIISLSGLILGVGLMIDNSIVVVDNISQKIEEGCFLVQSCVEGVNQIISPLISSLLTTCSVFIPLLFLNGITGALFFDQAIAVSIGIFASLIVSIYLIPVLYFNFYKNKNQLSRKKKLTTLKELITKNYEKSLSFFSRRPFVVYSIGLLGVFLGFFFITNMDYSQLPNLKQKETILYLDWNESITLDESQKRISNLMSDNNNRLKQWYCTIGEQKFLMQQNQNTDLTEVELYVQAISIESLAQIKQYISDQLNDTFPKAKWKFKPPKNVFEYIFSSNKEQLQAHIYNDNNTEIPLPDEINTIDENLISNVKIKEEIIIEILFEHLSLYDIKYEDLIFELKTILGENLIANLRTEQNFIPIKLSYDIENLDNEFNTASISNINGMQIPLSALVKLRKTKNYETIYADKFGENLQFQIKTPENNIEQTLKKIDSSLNNKEYIIRYSGDWFELIRLREELLSIVLIAVLLLYFIMAAQFESLWQPLIILIEIPIALGGALLILWLFNSTINIMAGIGIVVMSGIIINDSILKIHEINQFRKNGLGIKDAIKQGGLKRLNPIIMTSLTTILALMPFIFSDSLGSILQKPLALTIIGGLFLGTFVSLYFIPLIYYHFTKLVK